MFHKLRTTLGGAGFYAVLFLCLASVGTGAYFLLFRDAQPETALPASSAESTIVSEVPESDVTPEVPVVETVQPQPITETDADSAGGGEVSAASEEPAVEDVPAVNTAPVIPEAPSLVVSPLSGQVVAAFSVDALTYNSTLDDWRTHDGVDIAAAAGTNVLAPDQGLDRLVICTRELAQIRDLGGVDADTAQRAFFDRDACACYLGLRAEAAQNVQNGAVALCGRQAQSLHAHAALRKRARAQEKRCI